jgi:glycine cleavage system H protein
MPEPSILVLQDGGEIVEQPLAELPQEVWNDFQEEFLS